jgi:hypothetical protein
MYKNKTYHILSSTSQNLAELSKAWKPSEPHQA